MCKYTVSSTGTLVDSCSSMASCGGTAYDSTPKYYSWGMQSANAAGAIWSPEDYERCETNFGSEAYPVECASCCRNNSDEYKDGCCVPAKTPTSCF